MNYTVNYSDKARLDLRSIYEYIAYELLVPDTASKQIGRIIKSIRSLEKMPERFKLYEYEPWNSQGVRYFPIDNYLVFYLIQKSVVTIVRIIYGGRDISKQLCETVE